MRALNPLKEQETAVAGAVEHPLTPVDAPATDGLRPHPQQQRVHAATPMSEGLAHDGGIGLALEPLAW